MNDDLLIQAVQSNDIVMASVLLSKGINPNIMVRTEFGNQESLLALAIHKCPEIALLMIEAGADVNVEGSDRTPVMEAAYWGRYEILKKLIEQGAILDHITPSLKTTVLSCAAFEGTYEIMEELLKHDPCRKIINVQCTWNTTALMEATRQGYKNVVELLLANGADANLEDEDSKTALDIAHENAYFSIADILSKY